MRIWVCMAFDCLPSLRQCCDSSRRCGTGDILSLQPIFPCPYNKGTSKLLKIISPSTPQKREIQRCMQGIYKTRAKPGAAQQTQLYCNTRIKILACYCWMFGANVTETIFVFSNTYLAFILWHPLAHTVSWESHGFSCHSSEPPEEARKPQAWPAVFTFPSRGQGLLEQISFVQSWSNHPAVVASV